MLSAQDLTSGDVATNLGKNLEGGYPMKMEHLILERTRAESLMSEPEGECHLRTESVVSEPDSGPIAPPSPFLKPASEPAVDSASEPSSEPAAEVKSTPPRVLPSVARNARFRKSCFFDATLRQGVLDWATYNHMLLPIRFDWYQTPNDEYEHLKNHVCIWDVAAERQCEIVGPDAVELVELLTPRPLGDMKIGQCRYAIITDDEGKVLNDPIVSRIAEDRFWLSGADGDLVLWAKGLALGKKMKVKVFEAAVSPVAIQGPKSTALMVELFGDWVYDLKYFNFREVELDGMPIMLARSGWSPEVGYELYLQDESRGDDLWNRLWEAGQKYNLKPGSPNHMRRVEGGMLSYGLDVTAEHSITELGFPPSWVGAPGKCKEADFIGKEALTKIHEEGGPQRRVVGIQFSGTQECPPFGGYRWNIMGESSDESVGHLTSLCFSPALNAWIGLATVASSVAAADTVVCVDTPTGALDAVVKKLPFLPRSTMLPRPEAASA